MEPSSSSENLSELEKLKKETKKLKEKIKDAEVTFTDWKKWMKFLRRGKYIFQEIPPDALAKIMEKMKPTPFSRTMRSSKWMNSFMEENRDKIVVNIDESICLDHQEIREKGCEWIDEFTKNKNFFRLKQIGILNFGEDAEFLKSVLQKFEDKHIYSKELYLTNGPIAKEMFSILIAGKYILEKTTHLENIPLNQDNIIVVADETTQFDNFNDVLAFNYKVIGFKLQKTISIATIFQLIEQFFKMEKVKQSMTLHLTSHKTYKIRGELSMAKYNVCEKLNDLNQREDVFLAFKDSPIGLATVIVMNENCYEENGKKMVFVKFIQNWEEFREFFTKKEMEFRNDLADSDLYTSKWIPQFIEKKLLDNFVGKCGRTIELPPGYGTSPKIGEADQNWKQLILPPIPDALPEFTVPITLGLHSVDNTDFQAGFNKALEEYLVTIDSVLKIQWDWICYLNRGRFLTSLDERIVAEILKKLSTTAFIRSMSANKWIKAIIDRNRKYFVKNTDKTLRVPILDIATNYDLHRNSRATIDWTFQLGLRNWCNTCLDVADGFRFDIVAFIGGQNNYIDKEVIAIRIMKKFNEKRVLADKLYIQDAVLIQEMLDYFKPALVNLYEPTTIHHCTFPEKMIHFVLHSSDHEILNRALDFVNVGQIFMDCKIKMPGTARIPLSILTKIISKIRNNNGPKCVFLIVEQKEGEYKIDELPPNDQRKFYDVKYADRVCHILLEKCGEGAVAFFYGFIGMFSNMLPMIFEKGYELSVCQFITNVDEIFLVYCRFMNFATHKEWNVNEARVVLNEIFNDFFNSYLQA